MCDVEGRKFHGLAAKIAESAVCFSFAVEVRDFYLFCDNFACLA